MPVPTDTAAAADERVPATASEGAPACPAETVSSGGEENGGASSPVGSLSESCRAELETGSAGEKQASWVQLFSCNYSSLFL